MEGTDTQTVQGLAGVAYSWFETARRDEQDDESSYVRVKKGSPEWITELVYEAHGDFLPDDYRYRWIQGALECLSECDSPEDAEEELHAFVYTEAIRHEFADSETDVYTVRLLQWLSSNLKRVSYVDDAIRVSDNRLYGIIGCISAGQYDEIRETFVAVWQYLERKAGEA